MVREGHWRSGRATGVAARYFWEGSVNMGNTPEKSFVPDSPGLAEADVGRGQGDSGWVVAHMDARRPRPKISGSSRCERPIADMRE